MKIKISWEFLIISLMIITVLSTYILSYTYNEKESNECKIFGGEMSHGNQCYKAGYLYEIVDVGTIFNPKFRIVENDVNGEIGEK